MVSFSLEKKKSGERQLLRVLVEFCFYLTWDEQIVLFLKVGFFAELLCLVGARCVLAKE